MCQWTTGSLVKESEEQVSLVLVIRERRLKMTWAMLVPSRGTEFPWIAKRAARFMDQLWAQQSHAPVRQRARDRGIGEGSQTVPERPLVGESQTNGIIERAAGLVAGQARTLKAALEHRIETRFPPDARILCWLVEFAAYLMNRCDTGSDGKTPLHLLHGRKDNTPILEFGEKPARGGKWEPEFIAMLNSSSEAVVVTEQGLAIRTRSANIRRVPK